MSDPLVAAPDVPLTAHNLCRKFAGVPAVQNVSLTVREGEIFGLIGPDGAGKTTLIRLLAGLMKPETGEVRLLGVDPMHGSLKVRESLGYMPQAYSLYRDLSVSENLRFFSRLFGLRRQQYQERKKRLLEITRLQPFTARRAGALSGGMYKKLALACALLHRPRVLLLDEPTNGVDPISRRELWDLLNEFAADRMAILIATPYMDEAERCHRVGLINHGKLGPTGDPASLIRDFPYAVATLDGLSAVRSDELMNAVPGIRHVSFLMASARIVIEPQHFPQLERYAQQSAPGIALPREQITFTDIYQLAVSGEAE